jgi:hypothetical protein
MRNLAEKVGEGFGRKRNGRQPQVVIPGLSRNPNVSLTLGFWHKARMTVASSGVLRHAQASVVGARLDPEPRLRRPQDDGTVGGGPSRNRPQPPSMPQSVIPGLSRNPNGRPAPGSWHKARMTSWVLWRQRQPQYGPQSVIPGLSRNPNGRPTPGSWHKARMTS